MADLRSPLAHLDGAAVIERGGVRLADNPDVGKVNLRGDAGDAADRKSTRLNSSHSQQSRMPSSA